MTATPLAFYALPDRAAWMDQHAETAVCAEIDPEVWFPAKGGSPREAKRLCRSCLLLDACREWALAHPSETREGVWGGMTEEGRRAERRRRRRQSTAPVAGPAREAA